MGKAVKIFLFFPDFGVRYVRFWSRIFTYINTPLRHKDTKVLREIRRRFRRLRGSFSHKKAQNAQKEQKNDQKSALFNRREKKVYQVIR